jgi:transcription elongation factor Elf1
MYVRMRRNTKAAGAFMEYFLICPYCSQEISVVLDMSVRSQDYVVDCEVCCRAIQLRYVIHGEDVVEFEAKMLER